MGRTYVLIALPSSGHHTARAMELSWNIPVGDLLDLGEATDFGPQGDVHGEVLPSLECNSAVAWRSKFAQFLQSLGRLRPEAPT